MDATRAPLEPSPPADPSTAKAAAVPSESTPHAAGRGPDRRRRPTPIFSRYTFLGGRRRAARRAEEGEGLFVDRYSHRLVVLLLIFFTLTVLDSVFTVIYLRKGGEELNPIALWMLKQGDVPFVLLKGGLTAVCVLFVMLHKNFRYSRVALGIGFLFYFALAIYHIVLQIEAWNRPGLSWGH
jgi:hypothetical protein